MFSGFTGWHALVLLVIVVLIFGATRLPGLAKSVGQSMKIFRNEIKSDSDGKEKSASGTSADGTPATRADDGEPDAKSDKPAA
jgi:sec-independent protein translocase protein TatA